MFILYKKNFFTYSQKNSQKEEDKSLSLSIF